MAEPQHFDIAIVGSGIAGSALATALSGQGFSVALIEAQAPRLKPLPNVIDVAQFDPRVSALTPKSQKFLQDVGAWEGIVQQRMCPYTHMTVWDAEGTGSIEFDCSEVKAPALGHIVENRIVTAALLSKVRDTRDIELMSPVSVTACKLNESGGAQLSLDGKGILETDLVVAADGARSQVRQMLDFKTREWDYGHDAIVATVELERSHQATAWQRFLPSGPLAFLPLAGEPDKHLCSIVWSLREPLSKELLSLDETTFCRRLEHAFEHRLGRVLACSPRFAFPLRQRHAVDYVRPGVALVADAAHTIHPLAGQGINLGLQDVQVLAEEIVAGRARGAKPGQLQLLKRYQRRRKSENLLMMAAMDGFKSLFGHSALPIRLLRNEGMRTVAALGPIKRQLMHRAMGI